MSIKGACLCGKVGYEIRGPLFNASNCHCSMCRRQHGAAFATYAQFAPGNFRWTAGRELVRIFDPHGKGGWVFCSECGSTLAGTDGARISSITLGSVCGDPGIKPGFHIFAGSKASWHEIEDPLPQFEQAPPESLDSSGKAP